MCSQWVGQSQERYNAQKVEDVGKKRRPLCNAGDRGSRFAPSERRQTSNSYQLHEGTGNCECIKFNDTMVRTIQT